MAAHSLLLGYPYIPVLTSICSRNLRHIHYQCCSWCKRHLTHSNQHSQHREKLPKIDRN